MLSQCPELKDKDKNILCHLAVPQLVRRKVSGRYTMRLRETGSTKSIVSISLRTSNRNEAILRMREIAQTAKAFLLDNPEVSESELNSHLKSMAFTLLTDKVEDFWSGLEIDHLGDAKANLKVLAHGSLSVHQQAHIVKALEVISAAQVRVHKGDSQPLLEVISSLNTANTGTTTAGSPPETKQQEGEPTESELITKCLYWEELSAIYRDEHSINLKPATRTDIISAHKTLARFTHGIDWKTHTRQQVVSIRDAMINDGLKSLTVNKMLAKLSACINWAKANGYINDDFTKGLKLRGAESSRRHLTPIELKAVCSALNEETAINKKLFGQLSIITGARCGELAQLTRSDIQHIEGIGFCININDNNGKSLKTKASSRIVPLINGAYGFDINELVNFITDKDDNQPLFNMNRNVASRWFNKVLLPKALPEERSGDVVLHSLRHTLATLLKQAEVSENTAKDILGHAAQSITFGLYGKTKSVERMREALEAALRMTKLSRET